MKIAVIFPGYGSQFVGMGKELYDNHRIVQEYFEEASNCLSVNFVKLCFASSENELEQPQNAYTSLFLVSSAIAALLQQEGIPCDAVAGYNIGEAAALFAARGMNLPDGLYLLNKYAGFYQEALAQMKVSALRVMRMKGKQVQQICERVSMPNSHVSVAVYEAELVSIIAGHADAVDRARLALLDEGRRQNVEVEHVAAEIGLHSHLMDGIIDQCRMYLEKVDFKDLTVPLLESVSGRQIKRGSRIREYILERMHEPVRWVKVMKNMAAYDVIIEVGPGTKLSTMVAAMYPEKKVIAINTQRDLDELKTLIQAPALTPHVTEK